MEEKKRKDMEAMRQKSQMQQEKQRQQHPRHQNLAKKNTEVEAKGKPNLGSKPAISKVKQSKSEASVGIKKVAFDSNALALSKYKFGLMLIVRYLFISFNAVTVKLS